MAARPAHGSSWSATRSRQPTSLEAAIAEAEDADVRLRVQSLLFDVTAYVPDLDERRPALLESDPSPVVLAHRAIDAAYRSAPAGEIADLALRALEGGELLRVVGPQATYHLLVMALRHAEQPELADRALRAGESGGAAARARFAMYYMDHARAYWELMYGSVSRRRGARPLVAGDHAGGVDPARPHRAHRDVVRGPDRARPVRGGG